MYLISKKIRINQLFNYGFEQCENEQYYIRYIYEEYDVEKEREESGYGYKTIYVDKKTREIFAYNDYNDERIPMQLSWIKDLLDDNLIEEAQENPWLIKDGE